MTIGVLHSAACLYIADLHSCSQSITQSSNHLQTFAHSHTLTLKLTLSSHTIQCSSSSSSKVFKPSALRQSQNFCATCRPWLGMYGSKTTFKHFILFNPGSELPDFMVGSSLQLFCVWYQGPCHNGSQVARLSRWMLLGDHEPDFGFVASLGVVLGEPDRATRRPSRRRSARSATCGDSNEFYLSVVE